MYGDGEGVLRIAKVRLEERYSLITDPRSWPLHTSKIRFCLFQEGNHMREDLAERCSLGDLSAEL